MAIEQKIIDLINAEIDGELGDRDQAELEVLLENSAEARDLHDELRSLCSTLDAVEPEEPPTHMRHVIMNSLRTERPAARRPGVIEALFAAPALRYAAVFAAGVFLTLSIVNSGEISNRAFDDMTHYVGTVADPIDAQLESSVSVNELAVAGTVALRSAGPLLILDFDLVSRDPIEVEAVYTDRTIWFNGFAQLESSGTTVSAESGVVRLGMQGKRRYVVYLHNQSGRGTTVRLRFLTGDQVVHEASLDYAPGR